MVLVINYRGILLISKYQVNLGLKLKSTGQHYKMQQMQTAPRQTYSLGPPGGMNGPPPGAGPIRPLGPPGPPGTRFVIN